MKLNKEKILKVLLIVSFLPYIILLLVAIYNSVCGCTFMFSTCYGLDAFMLIVIVYVYMYCPVFLIAFAYEIFYLVWNKLRKNKR